MLRSFRRALRLRSIYADNIVRFRRFGGSRPDHRDFIVLVVDHLYN